MNDITTIHLWTRGELFTACNIPLIPATPRVGPTYTTDPDTVTCPRCASLPPRVTFTLAGQEHSLTPEQADGLIAKVLAAMPPLSGEPMPHAGADERWHGCFAPEMTSADFRGMAMHYGDRAMHLQEDDAGTRDQLAAWVQQLASALCEATERGEVMADKVERAQREREAAEVRGAELAAEVFRLAGLVAKREDARRITVRRTGGLFSFAASEYEVTYPNGATDTVWSPPWNDYGPEHEDAGALGWGAKRWIEIVEAWEAECSPGFPEDPFGVEP